MNYCHNCRHWQQLAPHSAYCVYCLDQFYNNGRLPLRSDPIPATDSLSKLYRTMEWS